MVVVWFGYGGGGGLVWWLWWFSGGGGVVSGGLPATPGHNGIFSTKKRVQWYIEYKK